MKILISALIAVAFYFSSCNNKTDGVEPELKPEITAFTPQSGLVGTVVNISGLNLSKVTSVKFNGSEASFKINGTVIEATVPSNATTGAITVVSPGGTNTSTNSFTVIPPPDPPLIIKVSPDNNATNGPVMIQGKFQEITSIKFNNKEALIDTLVPGTTLLEDLAIPLQANVTGLVTTRVPAGLNSGATTLSITNKDGTSLNYNFTVLASPPSFPNSPSKIIIKKKAKYIPVVFNDWLNEADQNRFIFIKTGATPNQPVGNLNVYGTDEDFVVTHVPTSTDKTIEVLISHANGTTEKLSGIYADSDFLPSNDPEWQRIIFYNPTGRQIVVHVKVKF